MKDEVRAFVIAQLQDMNYDTEGLDDDTTLGPAGVDLEPLALADLSVRVEDRFGVRFSDDDPRRRRSCRPPSGISLPAAAVPRSPSDSTGWRSTRSPSSRGC
jgi:acyl carrier protein